MRGSGLRALPFRALEACAFGVRSFRVSALGGFAKKVRQRLSTIGAWIVRIRFAPALRKLTVHTWALEEGNKTT